jgi:DNA-binding NarL/FixJ family response regulator
MIKEVKILLVDDHQIIIDGLKALLSGVDKVKVVAGAKNGKEALDLLKIIDADLVFIDIDMPILNGLDTTRIIKKEYPEIKVIILSMHSDSTMIKDIIELGADGYLLKNISKEDLVEAIEKVCKGERYFSSEVTLSLVNKDVGWSGKKLNIRLTSRETEILKLITEGFTNKEIGKKLFISHKTVDTHRTNLMKKVEVNNIAGLINFAIKNEII